jgi:hypothetical protein
MSLQHCEHKPARFAAVSLLVVFSGCVINKLSHVAKESMGASRSSSLLPFVIGIAHRDVHNF